MQIRLDGKIALVTGAAAGIGRAIAEGMAESGARVVVADIDYAAAEAVAEQIGGGAFALELDVSDVSACHAAVAEIIKRAGGIDILVNNAGICPLKPIEEVDAAFFDRLFAVNTRGAFFLSQAAAQDMKARQTGRIINISSVGGRTGGTLAVSVYAATKAALFSLTKSFATYLAPYGTANSIAPGPSHTALTQSWNADEALATIAGTIPLKRLGEPDDFKAAAVFLASDGASYITGATLDINGGFRMD